MTRGEAMEESIRVYALVKSWRYSTPYTTAVLCRWKELLDYYDGTSDKEPDSDWTPESIAHLEGAPNSD